MAVKGQDGPSVSVLSATVGVKLEGKRMATAQFVQREKLKRRRITVRSIKEALEREDELLPFSGDEKRP